MYKTPCKKFDSNIISFATSLCFFDCFFFVLPCFLFAFAFICADTCFQLLLFSRSSRDSPLILELFLSHLLGLLMGSVAKRIKVEIHYLSLRHLLY